MVTVFLCGQNFIFVISSQNKIRESFFEIFLIYRWSNYFQSSLALDSTSTSVIRRVPYEKWSNKWVKILKFWRTELSYAQNKTKDEKRRLLGIETCPSLNDIMEIRCIKCTRNNSYKPITNTAWVHARLCKLQKRVHLTLSRKW